MKYLYRFIDLGFVPKAVDLQTPTESKLNVEIPDQELWSISCVGGSSNIDGIKIELHYSEDGGVTFFNPFTEYTDCLITAHLSKGGVAEKNFSSGFELEGLKTDRLIKITILNFNTTENGMVSAWVEGVAKEKATNE